MVHFVYDGSFEGLLTAVFDVYEDKAQRAQLFSVKNYQPDAFAERRDVLTDSVKANRVWKGLFRKLSPQGLLNVYSVYLSERDDRETLLLAFFRRVFAESVSIEDDFSSPLIVQISQISRQIHREKHRFEAFVRFIHLKGDVYFASIEPDFNILPLIGPHFTERYADQRWIIYDTRRQYGLYYDLKQVQEVYFEEVPDSSVLDLSSDQIEEGEELMQKLWQVYFQSVNIVERKNMKLHRKHLPIRYWKYLIEKQI
ncbi:TIGR03915 family putative DNA repair protein [Xanthocytophaga agilis]|uniref:TIGR03915 family putative DNA repair protein n=1 Tax=Xanthocytophaga agilis TaxID=3048010 RepID=A0AAE3UH41_9BACT|nr:TIGR03915 family putative DNA repair protein [Xanthocytophaga agilis]MDJ1505050.1 TIGR03915 family putative DNA repair protein [Xanthocytophaga agilis]